MTDIMLELKAPGVATFDKDIRGYNKWLDEYKQSDDFRRDRFLRENKPVFASVSKNAAGKDEVGSVYLGGEQGKEGARARLLHKNGPMISHYNCVFRYSYEEQSPEQTVRPIDYEHLENEKDRRLFEHLGHDSDHLYPHKSRGSPKPVEEVTGLEDNEMSDLIAGVRYAMKLKDDYLRDHPDENADAATRANNFLYAFMSEHNELKKIPLNKAALVPIPNYYKKEEENSSPSFISRIFHWLFS